MRVSVAIGLYGLVACGTAEATKSREKSSVAASTRGEPDEFCKNILVDAVSVQDSTGSLWPDQWQQVLVATTQLIDAIELGPGKSRIAPVSFGQSAATHWYLNDPRAQDPKLAKEEILKLPHLKQVTNTAAGLNKAYDIFSRVATTDPSRYNDKRVVRVLFVATDGCVNYFDSIYPSKEAHMQAALGLLRGLPNLVILAVGIGNQLCKDEIRQIAGCAPACSNEPCPNAKFTNFEELLEEIPKYMKEVCDQAVEIVEEKEDEETCCPCSGEHLLGEDPHPYPDQSSSGEGAEEKEEGANKAGVIAGGVIGGLALLAGVGGGAYAYSRAGTGTGSQEGAFDSEGQDTDDLLGEKEVSAEAEGSMYA